MLLAVAGFFPALLHAGRYPATGTQSFTGAGPLTNLGDSTLISSSNNGTDGNPAAVVTGNALRLTQYGTGGTLSSFKLPDLDAGKALLSWDMTLQVRMSASGTPADGWSLTVGAIPDGNGSGEGGYVVSKGLVIAFDTYDNGGDTPSIEVFANGISVGNFPQTFSYDNIYRNLALHWDQAGLDLTYTVAGVPVNICTDLAVPGYLPLAGHSFAFSARTGGLTQDTFLDNLLVTTVPESPLETGGPVISEFSTDNATVLEDENGDSSDWIEIYNGKSTPTSLAGWTLSDVAATPGKWAFPNIQIPAYSYLTVYASAKNRVNTAFPLHTNFTLLKASGYLGLFKAGGVLASEFNYGQQAEDIAYGLLPNGAGYSYGYLETATPGRKNTGLQAAGPPAEDVVFLKDGVPTTGGLFSGSFSLAVQTPVTAGAVVRYTLNNTTPAASSMPYSAALPLNATTTVRARVFAPGRLPGAVSSRTFVQLDSSLTNYHSSGKPFSSNIPIIVLDSYGVPVDAYTDPGQARPYRLTYAVVIDKNPLATSPDTNRAQITGPVDFQGRSGTHVRGESSSGFAQKSYSWEFWNNEDQDKKASLLGFPAESDWVLHAPYTDKTLMRNYLVYDRMRTLNGKAAAMGVKFVEVFFNQDGGPLAESDYRGVYVLVEKIKRDGDRVNLEKLNELMTDSALISGGYIFKKDKAGIGNTSFNTATYGQNFQFVEPEAPNAAQQTWITTYMNKFESALAGVDPGNATTGYPAYINPLSFVDNQWFVEMTKQIDGYRLSTYFYKERNAKVSCAPLWDYNLSLYNANYLAGDTHTGWYYSQVGGGDYYYWAGLQAEANYKILHWDRYWEFRRGLFATNTILNYIDGLASQLVNGSTTPVTNSMANQAPLTENPAMRHYRQWSILGSYVWPNPGNTGRRTKYWTGPNLNPADYVYSGTGTDNSADAEVDAMKDFLRKRLAWIDDQNVSGTTIYRPPNFSLSGGNVPAGTSLTISRYTGTAPAGFTYASGGTMYYTNNGNDPRSSTGAVAGTAYSSPLVLNSSATIKARYLRSGQWSPLTSASFVVNAAPASAANLVISEICYRPAPPAPGTPEFTAGYTAGNNFEYIELLNVSGGNVDLTNCQFTAGVTFSFAGAVPARLTLAPGARVLVVENEAAFALRYGSGLSTSVLGAYTGNLSNGGETLTLLAASGGVIASVAYGTAEPWPVAAQDADYSLVLSNPAPNATYAAENFRASAQPGGTPGTAAGPAYTGSPAADSDHDGFSDLLEYATGSLPANPGSFFVPQPGTVNILNGATPSRYFTFSYRRSNAADGVSYLLELSPTLTNWAPAGSALTYLSTTNNGDGTSTVTWRTTQPTDNLVRQFMRLRITQP
jgi:hypothetical protein